jgi:hypothetical protein
VITAVSFSLAFGDDKFFDFAGVRDQRVIAFDMRGAREERQTSRSARHGSAEEFESSSVSYRTMVLTMTGLDEPVLTADEIRRQSVEIALRTTRRPMDGRIDDPKAGGKGRAVNANFGPSAVWHTEGGRGTRGSVWNRMRPEPLAK